MGCLKNIYPDYRILTWFDRKYLRAQRFKGWVGFNGRKMFKIEYRSHMIWVPPKGMASQGGSKT